MKRILFVLTFGLILITAGCQKEVRVEKSKFKIKNEQMCAYVAMYCTWNTHRLIIIAKVSKPSDSGIPRQSTKVQACFVHS